MRAAVAAVVLAIAVPAAAVTPIATEDALASGALAVAAPGLAACLAGWADAVGILDARLILPGRERVTTMLLHHSGVRTGCVAAVGQDVAVQRRWAVHPDDARREGRATRVFAPERRCAAARAVQGAGARVLGWLEEPPCR